MNHLHQCQQWMHDWGEANSATFEASKEGVHILHPRRHSAGDFRILGVLFDTQLAMARAIHEIAGQARWNKHGLTDQTVPQQNGDTSTLRGKGFVIH